MKSNESELIANLNILCNDDFGKTGLKYIFFKHPFREIKMLLKATITTNILPKELIRGHHIIN